MDYYKRARALATRDNTPTLTDQSQAHSTDINVIVGGFLKNGTAPGASGTEMYEDFSELPRDLRGFIEASRTTDTLRNRLPEQLRDIPTDELVRLTPEELNAKLKPTTTEPGIPPEDAAGAK